MAVTYYDWEFAPDYAAFDPTTLFPGGNKGAWHDAQDMSTLFQDAGFTTPAVVGQPVGGWLDKSGNGLHLTQSGSARPTLRQDANGAKYVDFVGAGRMATDLTKTVAMRNVHFLGAFYADGAGGNARIVAAAKSDSNDYGSGNGYHLGTGFPAGRRFHVDFNNSAVEIGGGSIPLGVYEFYHRSSDNGLGFYSEADGNVGTTTAVVTTTITPAQYGIGASVGLTTGSNLTGKIYEMMLVPYEMTTLQLSNTRGYLKIHNKIP